MNKLTFDHTGFAVNGENAFFISGEFHYFRVPAFDWKRRMELYKNAGGNCIATYVPWCIHEQEEGKIVFDDMPQRNLTKFLQTAKEVGLMVVLRPGPYQYSELVGSGLPDWLLSDYPQLMAKDINGNTFHDFSISYLHPLFLEKVRRYYIAFAEVVRPFIGDPVVMLQTDNEATGVHVWFGSIDYNRDTYGFGKEDGRYAQFLQHRYGDIAALNAAYQTEYQSFAEIMPVDCGKGDIVARRRRDYYDCYYDSIADYMVLLSDWLYEDGLKLPICHNSANPSMNSCFLETVQKMDKPFLLGSDHYYNLHQDWSQNNPTPQYAIRVYYSMEMMRLMGMPPSVLELPGGSPSDTPPILPNDLLACYYTNLAMGMKGLNYYIYTGGENFEDTGATCKVYDYNAFVRADGTLNATFESLKTINGFMNSHTWMQRANRRAAAVVGFDWFTTREENSDFAGGTTDSFRFTTNGILYTMMCGKYGPEMVNLTDALDLSRPLIVASGDKMRKVVQENLVRFVQDGGKLLLFGILPTMDENGYPCGVLREFLSNPKTVKPHRPRAVCVREIGNVYGLTCEALFEELPKGAVSIGEEIMSHLSAGFDMKVGKGRVIYLAASWMMKTFDQANMMEYLLLQLGAKPTVKSSNRNIFTSLIADKDGHKVLFVMNLYSSPQDTTVLIYDESGNPAEEYTMQLGAMEVKTLDL